ncbi:hypothetical protein C8R43DRAFT_1140033 [Mycena crocata]|nr:hypothetical protein C8R43DRAFT_1140033 [Mycena crocata]
MPPNGWTTPEEYKFLYGQIPKYIKAKASGLLWQFWPAFIEEWFRLFPEEPRLGFSGVTAEGDAVALMLEQEKTAGVALAKRKEQLETWLRWHSQKFNKVAVSQNKRDDSLENGMFQRKLPRRRPRRATEWFQKRNKALVDATLDAEGFSDMNEAYMSATVADWGEETDKVQKVRVKETQAARMRLRTRVVDELFKEASDEELRCIEELILEEKKELAVVKKGGKKGRAMEEQRDAEDTAREPTPEEYQIGDGKSAQGVGKKTGWFGITILGGPNPRYDGGLSMKTICFGQTQSGNDFEVAHGSFDESISKHFQAFLKRSFPIEVRRARAIQESTDDAAPALPPLDGLFRLPDEPPKPQPAPREKPKRVRKKTSKKHAASAPSAPVPSASASATVASPLLSPPVSLGVSVPLSDGSGLASATGTRYGSLDPFEMDGDAGVGGFAGGEGEDISLWPAGMGPPSSPSTAEAAANAERGGAHGATYMHTRSPSSPPIDPALLDKCSGPNRLRPAWRVADILTSPSPTGTAGGFHFPALGSTATPAPLPSRLNGLINRFHYIMDPPPAPARPPSLALDSVTAHVDVPNVNVANSLPLTGAAGNTPPVVVSPNSPARISRISSTAAGTSKPVESAADGSASSDEETPFSIGSRPMANDPTSKKVKKVASTQETTSRGRGRGRKQTTDAGTKEAAAKMAGKAATKKGRKGKDATGALENTNADKEHATPPIAPPATPTTAPPALIYTTTNNSAAYARMARKQEAEKKAAEITARKEKARVYNPDGPTDLVILPGPGRAQRARKPAKNFDGSAVALEKKLTRAEQQANKNRASEDALLARTGKKRGAEEAQLAPSRATKKSKK